MLFVRFNAKREMNARGQLAPRCTEGTKPHDRRQTSSATKLGAGGHWRNWVGNQSFIARHKAEPSSEDELAALVHEASRQNLPIRVAGSGHSFTPVVATSGLLLSLKNMRGPFSADLDRKRVVVRAGTKIGDIGRALKRIGLSLADEGGHRHSGDRRRSIDRHAWHRKSGLAASRPRAVGHAADSVRRIRL